MQATRGSLALAEDTETGSRPSQPVLGPTGCLRPRLSLVPALEPLRPAHQWVEAPLLQSQEHHRVPSFSSSSSGREDDTVESGGGVAREAGPVLSVRNQPEPC